MSSPRPHEFRTDPARAILGGASPKATGFIVTIYGDVVEPRGGTLWMGTLIACCARHGISESLVRTAVSRLVGAGRLVGERVGRRSFYRLTDAAQAEFSDAARILYTPPAEPRGWLLALGTAAPVVLPGWAAIGPAAALAPDRADIARPEGALTTTCGDMAAGSFAAAAAGYWPLGPVGAEFDRFTAIYAPLASALAASFRPDGATALALRLRLVHRYRHAALADPRLPASALPPDWPGPEARRLFLSIYLDLSARADGEVGAAFESGAGPLPVETPGTRIRMERMAAERARRAGNG